MVAWLLYAALAVATIAYAYFKLIYRDTRPNDPPFVSGHWFYGSAKDFGDDALGFFERSRQKVGDIFTVRFFNQYLTVVLDIRNYQNFGRERNFDFNPIIKQVNSYVYDIDFPGDGKLKSNLSQSMSGKYLSGEIETFAQNLSKEFAFDEDHVTSDKTVINNTINTAISDAARQLRGDLKQNPADMNIERLLNINPKKTVEDVGEWRQVSMLKYCNDTLYTAFFYTIFGRGNPSHSNNDVFEPKTFQKNFEVYNKYFVKIAVGTPRWVFPEAAASYKELCKQPTIDEMLQRDGLSNIIKYAIEFMLKNNQPLRAIHGHNLLMLHLGYNSLRSVFWCIYKLTQDEKALAALHKELGEAIEAKRSGDQEMSVDFTMDDINSLRVLNSFVTEILRWVGSSVMPRVCLADTNFTTPDGKTYLIRKGEKILLATPACHMQADVFEKPDEFQYDRHLKDHFKYGEKIDTPVVVHGFLCPGTKISILQIKWFTMTMINAFKIELVEGESTSPNFKAFGHEIRPPTNDVQIRMKKREVFCRLNFLKN